MTTLEINKTIQRAQHQADRLTAQMDAILKENDVEIAENLGHASPDVLLYSELWKQRKYIYNTLDRISSILDSYLKFELADLS